MNTHNPKSLENKTNDIRIFPCRFFCLYERGPKSTDMTNRSKGIRRQTNTQAGFLFNTGVFAIRATWGMRRIVRRTFIYLRGTAWSNKEFDDSDTAAQMRRS